MCWGNVSDLKMHSTSLYSIRHCPRLHSTLLSTSLFPDQSEKPCDQRPVRHTASQNKRVLWVQLLLCLVFWASGLEQISANWLPDWGCQRNKAISCITSGKEGGKSAIPKINRGSWRPGTSCKKHHITDGIDIHREYIHTYVCPLSFLHNLCHLFMCLLLEDVFNLLPKKSLQTLPSGRAPW